MTIQEAHIYFETVLRQSNIHVEDHLDRKEIDLLLYREMLNWVNSKFPVKNYPSMSKDYSSTNRNDYELSFLEESLEITDLYKYTDTEIYGVLPKNFMHPVKSKSSVGCGIASYIDSNITLQIIPFPTGKSYSQYLIRVFKDDINYDIFDLSNYSGFATITEELKIYLINALIGEWDIYWQSSPFVYVKDHFIIPPGLGRNYDNIVVYVDGLRELPVNQVVTAQKYVAPSGVTYKYQPNTEYDKEYEDFYQKNPFAKSQRKKPTAYYQKGKIVVNHNNSFVVDRVKIDYIRTPRIPSYDLNIDMEVNTHNGVNDSIVYSIIERAASRAGAYIAVRNQQLIENKIITNE